MLWPRRTVRSYLPGVRWIGLQPEEDKPFAQCHTCYGDGTIETSVCPHCGGVGEVDDEYEEESDDDDDRKEGKTNARISNSIIHSLTRRSGCNKGIWTKHKAGA